jgi:ACR3 family arsenite transporter
VPWATLALSVGLFVVVPLGAGALTRRILIRRKGEAHFDGVVLPRWNGVTTVGLLLTLVLLFSFQGDLLLSQPLDILMIAVPLVLQTFLIFFIAYLWARAWRLPHDIAAPAGMIGASNFFELSVAVAISLFGTRSPAALATVVGVLTEVPVMLLLVGIANRTTRWFPAREDRP